MSRKQRGKCGYHQHAPLLGLVEVLIGLSRPQVVVVVLLGLADDGEVTRGVVVLGDSTFGPLIPAGLAGRLGPLNIAGGGGVRRIKEDGSADGDGEGEDGVDRRVRSNVLLEESGEALGSSLGNVSSLHDE